MASVSALSIKASSSQNPERYEDRHSMETLVRPKFCRISTGAKILVHASVSGFLSASATSLIP